MPHLPTAPLLLHASPPVPARTCHEFLVPGVRVLVGAAVNHLSTIFSVIKLAFVHKWSQILILKSSAQTQKVHFWKWKSTHCYTSTEINRFKTHYYFYTFHFINNTGVTEPEELGGLSGVKEKGSVILQFKEVWRYMVLSGQWTFEQLRNTHTHMRHWSTERTC